MRLGQFGELLAQRREHVDGFLSAVLLGENDAFEEAGARALGALGEVGFQAGQRCGVVALLMQLDRLRVGVGFGRCAAGEPAEHQGRSREADEGHHRAILFSEYQC